MRYHMGNVLNLDFKKKNSNKLMRVATVVKDMDQIFIFF